jgi:hypothetical protein
VETAVWGRNTKSLHQIMKADEDDTYIWPPL